MTRLFLSRLSAFNGIVSRLSTRMRSEVGTTKAKHDAHFKETKEKGYASGFPRQYL
jgi:hypothetical protein